MFENITSSLLESVDKNKILESKMEESKVEYNIRKEREMEDKSIKSTNCEC